jgi:hypothetical protein
MFCVSCNYQPIDRRVLNADSLKVVSIQIKKRKKENKYWDSVAKRHIYEDSIKRPEVYQQLSEIDREIKEEAKKDKEDRQRFDCSDEQWQKVKNHQIFIGMTLEMLKYEKGSLPNPHISNYGNGNEYRYCYDDGTCFYCKSDGIITSYN